MALAEVALLVPFLKVDFQDYFKKKLPANPEITVLMGGWLWKLDFQKISNTMALQSWLAVSVCQGLSSVETVVYLWECVVPALAPKSSSDPGWTVSRKQGRNQQRQNKLALGGSESPDAVARCHTWKPCQQPEFLWTLLEISELILLAFRHKTKHSSVTSTHSLTHGELELSVAGNTTAVLFRLALWENAGLTKAAWICYMIQSPWSLLYGDSSVISLGELAILDWDYTKGDIGLYMLLKMFPDILWD